MVNKKAYIKTLEAVIAIVIFLIFITAVLVINKEPEKEIVPQDIALLQDSILNKIQTTLELRKCLVENDDVCINDTINSSIPKTIGYNFDICNQPDPLDCTIKDFPLNKTIYVDSLMIKENQISIFTLYLWGISE